MRRIWTITAFAALSCAACTSSGAAPSGSSSPTAPITTVSPTTPLPSTSQAGPPRPGRPTLPADVPRTGPNTKPGEKPPIMPLEATQHTPDGAKSFAEFFIKTIDWGYATTSSAYMRHYFRKTCLSCSSFADGFDTAKARHDRFIGGRITVGISRLRSRDIVAVPLAITAFEQLMRGGRVRTADGAHSHERFDVTAEWATTGWRVRNLALET